MLPEREPPGPAPSVPETDALPEYTAYADTGCDVLDRQQYPSCLACPLPACIHDARPDRAALAARQQQRRRVAGELAERGRTVAQIARALHVGQHTVRRDLRAVEEERREVVADEGTGPEQSE